LDRFRFRREIEVAAQLKYPHIVPVLSAGEHKDLVWYATPFIAGQSLRSAVKYGPMPVSDVLRVLHDVAEALDYAHGEGVVHGDINPATVLQSGTHTLVTDLGVGKALVVSLPESAVTRIGTHAYMAPEQLAGDPGADHRIDIYAVGVLASELLKRRSPFAESIPSTPLAAGWSQESQPLTDLPDIPRSLSDLVMRCLSREPDERPATARELLNALDEISSAEAAAPAPLEPPPEPTIEPTVEPAPEPAPEPALEPALEPVSLTPAETTPERAPAEQTLLLGLTYPQGNKKKMLAGGLVLILPIAAGAILLSRRSGTATSGDTVSREAVSPVSSLIESAPLENSPEKVETRKPVSARQRALRARADSIQKARAEWAKLAAQKESLQAESARRAAELRDSLRGAEEMRRNQARRAAAALLANPRALESFMQGATHKGGLLGNKRMGDLQTQIDALQPFLNASGLSYEQFKDIVKASGIGLFDKFGRMVPDSLHRFAGTDR
jgi:serine/threonine-protein kinase